MRVADLMTKDVTCIRASEHLDVAAKLMWECDCGALPVLDETGQRVVGMITDRDICMATWTQNSAPNAIPVSRAMSAQVYLCSPQDALADAERVMRSKQVRRVPVVDASRRVVGILSLADIARSSERPNTKMGDSALRPEEVTSTLANICQGKASGQASAARPM